MLYTVTPCSTVTPVFRMHTVSDMLTRLYMIKQHRKPANHTTVLREDKIVFGPVVVHIC